MRYILCVLLLLFSHNLFAGLIISEISPNSSDSDWVEVFYDAPGESSVDISRLYVTMYYGTNEPLSNDPVTLYSYDRPETPYDDRYAVVYLAKPGTADETDYTGDTNRNGRIDLYCNNYSGSLWNAECVVAIDCNDDPSDGMTDFASWSNNDGSPSDTMLGYTECAIRKGHWSGRIPAASSMMISVPSSGLLSHQSLSRKTSTDTNRPDDFSVSDFQTPGKPNIIKTTSGGKIFSIEKEKITVIPGTNHRAECVLLINKKCNIRLRVFSDIGQLVYDSGNIKDIFPGREVIEWKDSFRAKSGLYIAAVEGSVPYEGESRTQKFFFIVTRYR